METYGVVCLVALLCASAVCCFPLSEGDEDSLSRSRRADLNEVIKAAADTEAQSDSKASHGMAESSSSTKGSAVFVSKKPHHVSARSPRASEKIVEIAMADTKADSDSKASDGVAASSSSTKGTAAFVSKRTHHH